MFSGGGGGEVREGPLAVAEEGKAKVASFQEHLPLITAICNPGLRERHWVALAEIVGFEVKRDEVTSLKRLLDHDIAMHISKITEISDSASREWSIEKALDKMMADWQGLAFELGPWKETGARARARAGGRGGRACACACAWRAQEREHCLCLYVYVPRQQCQAQLDPGGALRRPQAYPTPPPHTHIHPPITAPPPTPLQARSS